MARIAGIDLPNEKRVEIGLTYIYGIGRHTANEILKETKINPDTRVKGLPVRGQNTKQNARTRKGPKKTVSKSKKEKNR